MSKEKPKDEQSSEKDTTPPPQFEKPKDEQSSEKDTTPPPQFVRFEQLLKKVLALSKEELDKKKAEHEQKTR